MRKGVKIIKEQFLHKLKKLHQKNIQLEFILKFFELNKKKKLNELIELKELNENVLNNVDKELDDDEFNIYNISMAIMVGYLFGLELKLSLLSKLK